MNPINCAFILSRDYFLTVGHICLLVVRRADYSMQSLRVMLLVAVHTKCYLSPWLTIVATQQTYRNIQRVTEKCQTSVRESSHCIKELPKLFDPGGTMCQTMDLLQLQLCKVRADKVQHLGFFGYKDFCVELVGTCWD